MRHGITRLSVIIIPIALCGLMVGAGDHGKASTPKGELPGELKNWSFLIGQWDLATTRFSFGGDIIETETGSTSFSIAPGGRCLLETQHSMLNGNPLETLNMFAFNPRNEELEIARSDSAHHAFNIKKGSITESRIDLVEKHPNPDSDVTRRWSYVKQDGDHVVEQLDFSLDQGATWIPRSRIEYARKK